MTHEIDLIMKIWPGCGRDEEPAKRTILFDMETARQLLTEYRQQSAEGYLMKVD